MAAWLSIIGRSASGLATALFAVLLSSEARADLLVGNSNSSTLSCSSGSCTPMPTLHRS